MAGHKAILLASLFILLATSAVMAQVNTAPFYLQSVYVYIVEENLEPGNEIVGATNIQAFDLENDPITYSIDPQGLNGNLFEVQTVASGNNSVGILFLRNDSAIRLDREVLTPDNEPLRVFVRVSDGIDHDIALSVAEVLVLLLDVNDEIPTFTNLDAVIPVSEDTNLGTPLYEVEATDDDTGNNAQILYFIAGESDMFVIDVSTGVISLNRGLNFDVMGGREHQITVNAEDRGQPANTAAATLTIEVMDVNDLPPVFELPEYSIAVHENVTQGMSVIQVTAFDGDRGVNDNIIYTIVSGNLDINGTESFDINMTTGMIFVNVTMLDRETHEEYRLTVEGREENDENQIRTVEVTITVLDINDNSPFFETPVYMANISEIASIGAPVLTVTAMDPDTGSHGQFIFSLEPFNENVTLPFDVTHDEGSGVATIQVAEELDFETTNVYNFMAVVTEVVENQPRNGTARVTITVFNENDNNPIFENDTYTASIPENVEEGALVIQVVATDADFGTFGSIAYSLVSGHMDRFNISVDSGIIENTEPLNFEETPQYIITVEATDLAGDQADREVARAVLTVNVENLNDNTPVFTDNGAVVIEVNVAVQEEMPVGSLVFALEISDADGDLNEFSYELVDDRDLNHFTFDPNAPDQIVTNARLDYDVEDSSLRWYTLTVFVNDSLNENSLTLNIHIEDINDNDPVFENSSYTFEVAENIEIGTLVDIVTASDEDSDLFGAVEYLLQGVEAEQFFINATTGAIYTAVTLDRESQGRYDLVAVASDSDPDPETRRVTSVPVSISVTDRNDNTPEFGMTSYFFEVEENSPSVSFFVSATDEDIGSNGEIVFKIIEGNTNDTFMIDTSTGEIGRNPERQIDREFVARYDLVIIARDRGTQPLNSTVNVRIDILDQNDVIPQFPQISYNETLLEDVPTGSTVIQLGAVDTDADGNGRLQYTITSQAGGDGSASFTIEADSGVVTTVGTFDRESFAGPYSIIVLAEDGGFPTQNSGLTTLVVYIMDVNDNEPEFDALSYSETVMEELPVGQFILRVQATDSDQPDEPNSLVSYDITNVIATVSVGTLSPDIELLEYFYINSTSGELFTNVSLDYEDIRSFRAVVTARDMGDSQRSSSVFVTVDVSDINDGRPDFTEDIYEFDILEDTSINSRFSGILANDDDDGSNAEVTYSSNISDPFSIDESTGELILQSSLDFEDTRNYTFSITATDGGDIPLVDSALVVIRVIDVNDHSPIFDQELYSEQIDEDNYTSMTLPLLTVRALDEDSGTLGMVTYSIAPGDDGNLFAIKNDTGMVSVVGEVDREVTDMLRATIIAQDGGNPPRSSTAQLLIPILDVNDNQPMFGQDSYEGTIEENMDIGETILRVSATDDDQGSNGIVLFSITDTRFEINSTTGWIVTAAMFNFEQQDQYSFTVNATDNSTDAMSSSVSVTVNITDVNDLPPVFDPIMPSLTLLENASLGIITTVNANDGDSGTNAEVRYQISNDEGRFSINSDGVIELVLGLDREITELYNLTITATDRGQPQMTATANLSINVADVNDVTPQFSQDAYSFLVSEDVPITSTIATVTATDMDLALNGQIEFTIIQGNDDGRFVILITQIDEVTWTGAIRSSMQFDYEDETSYSLRIQATDQAPPFNTNFANLTLTILDTNDNPPSFSMPAGYVLLVPEGVAVGTAVGTVIATDADGASRGTLVYSFVSGTSSTISSTFSIDNSTGVITLSQLLNFEDTPEYDFQVQASDISSEPRSTSVNVTVRVQDRNEFAPEFDQLIYGGEVFEEISPPAPVVRVNATERDTGTGAAIRYRIAAGGANRFEIDEVTGLIETSAVLDREDISRYILTVEARDMGAVSLTSFVQVDITVLDRNDNAPAFEFVSYEYTILESAEPGTALSPVLPATDQDSGSNANITYTLSGGPFVVDAITGVVTVGMNANLDRESTTSYTLTLTATDQGSDQMSSSIELTVILADVNDNIPDFAVETYTARVAENLPEGVSVVMVVATDEDDDEIIYSILRGDEEQPRFTIRGDTGLIVTTSNPLNREAIGTYTLTVQATEDRNPFRSAEVEVIVTVEDVNDNLPLFTELEYDFNQPEQNQLDVVIAQIQAVDDDNGSNADVMYFISRGNDDGIFSILPSTGELIAEMNGLDFESQREYTLRVIAVDQAPDAADRLTSTTTVTITVEDVNDNPPVFSQPQYFSSVLENATLGELVLIVSATDMDTGDFGEVSYRFQSAISDFEVDETLGEVRVSNTLDSEIINRYELVMEATDRGNPSRIGTADIFIDVININDNNPRFDRSFYVAEVSEGVPIDTTVMTLTATDLDNSVLTYDIIGGNDEGYFKIASSTGVIQTARILDRETVAVFSLTVVAIDDGMPPQNGTTTLQVTITDVNDEAPRFLESEYFATVIENSPVGVQVLPEINGTTTRIEAQDADEPNTQNSRVLYSLQGPDASLFSIDFDTGIVTVARGTDLNREERSMLTITVVARDSVPAPNTQSSSVELNIEILDENDVSPIFTQPFGYAIAIPEDTAVASTITTSVRASDPDRGEGGVVVYSITNANPLSLINHFNINSSTGDIVLLRSLDRETIAIITLTVTAQDQGVPVLNSVVNLQITVTDVNDNPPVFSPPMFITSVLEIIPIGASIFEVTADDPDISFNGEVTYSVIVPDGLFTVNRDTGVITSTNTLDHEIEDVYNIIVQACDSGNPRMCANATITLNVEDVNDEAPQFDLPVYQVDIFDDYASGTTLLQPVAIDRDSGTNAVISYSLQDEQSGLLDRSKRSPGNLFEVNTTTGQIYLDCDILPSDVGLTYRLTIAATDSGDNPLTGTAEIIIHLLNTTLHSLRFVTSYNFYTLDENDGTFNMPLPVDAGSVTSAMFNPDPDPSTNPLQLFSSVAFIQLKADDVLDDLGLGNINGPGLDREIRSLYTVVIRAEGSGSSVAYTSVTLQVNDVNDETPEFLQGFYRFSVEENSPPDIVGIAEAVDRDEGDEITYSIVTDVGGAFVIDSMGVINTTRGLNREDTEEYIFSVSASDTLNTATATVVVTVDDVNDVTPNFTESVYVASIAENVPPGSSVITVIANDDDAGESGVVVYTIVAGDITIFELDSTSGVITTRTALDFEQTDFYQVRVRATDNGAPQLFNESRVDIQILDFNDCPPEFLNPPSSMEVAEETVGVGSIIADFEVNDCDSGLNGRNGTRFSIIAGDVDGRFNITKESGLLTVATPLDRETQESYLLSIQAIDSAGSNSLFSVIQITVIVTDINDNRPEFVQSNFSITVSEGEDLSQDLIVVSATDNDADVNGEIQYILEGDQGIFRINEATGAIQLGSTLDRETTENYILTVTARDSGVEPMSSTATVFVTVEDENDNQPMILNIASGVTTVEVSERANIGYQVFQVNATDGDAGRNGEIFYSLVDASLPFRISSMQGVITVNGPLDYEEQNEYTLVIRAVDQGSVMRLTGIATLTVEILDQNDNAPVFPLDEYTVEQQENTAAFPDPNSVVLVVVATDRDQTGTPNAEIEYSIVGGDTTTFGVNSVTGEIFNRVTLDRENVSLYELTILANNSLSSDPMFSMTTVRIIVRDENDEMPIFDSDYFNATISELMEVDTSILRARATDRDEQNNPNSEISYILPRQTNNPFHLDQNTGELFLLRSLDFETTSQYILTVVAEDKGIPVRNSSATIVITLIDENDERPQFLQDAYMSSVGELEDNFPFLLQTGPLEYRDQDTELIHVTSEIFIDRVTAPAGPDGIAITDTSLFSVNNDDAAMTGQLFLTRSVDREQIASYQVTLLVRNTELGIGELCEDPNIRCPLSDETTVTVIVQDENDNAPQFERTSYSAEVSTTANTGTSVLTVRANDSDTSDFGQVQYRLDDSDQGRFRIDTDTGTIFTRDNLENLEGVTSTLIVTAFDNFGNSPSRSSQAMVTLLILNDFQRVLIGFECDIETVLNQQMLINSTLQNISSLTIVLESIETGNPTPRTNYIFHGIDPASSEIVDYFEFLDRIENREDELATLLDDCRVIEIIPIGGLPTEPPSVVYPDAVDSASTVIIVLCGVLTVGAAILIFLAFRQRYVALHDVRHKLLADVFYGTPGSASVVENIHQENYQLQALELRGQAVNRQNPMFVHPYDNWAGVDTSGIESVGDTSSLKRDNPLYESQEIRMEMFADVSDEETEAEADEAELLAAALQEDEEEDTSVTAI